MIFKPLFESSNLRLASIDLEKDAVIESGWSNDPAYTRMFGLEVARPLSVFEVKQKYEKIEKEVKESSNKFYFAVHTKSDDRLIGMAFFDWVEWSNGNCSLKIGIGNPEDRGKGWGRELLEMMLRFAFAELNMHRITVMVPEYNQVARHLFSASGFKEEVVLRKALNRQGRRWDQGYYGLLRREWEESAARGKEKKS